MAHTLADPARFFARLRRLTGPLDQGQVGIVNALLTAGALWPSGWLAYALATAWHEARFTPQAEWGRGRGRAYAQPGRYGQAQYGRGLVQLTWDRNYEWADRALGLKGALLATSTSRSGPIWPSPFWSRAWSRGPSPGSPWPTASPARAPTPSS
jgi:hypothetical protein